MTSAFDHYSFEMMIMMMMMMTTYNLRSSYGMQEEEIGD